MATTVCRGGQMACEQREFEHNSGSALRTLIGPDTSAVGEDDGAGDSQTEAAAAE